MNLRCTLLGAAAALGLMLAGCGSARPIKYYSLEPPAISAASTPLSVSLLVGHFRAPMVYRDTRIAYRTGPNEMGLYEDHRWSEPPALMVEQMFLRTLRATGQYRSVQALASNAKGDYVLRGRVERFEEVEGSALSTRVAFQVALYDPKEGHTLWTRDYAGEEPVTGKNVSEVAAAINRNLQRGVSEVTAELGQYLASHPPAPTQ